jgi:tRNA threonylcarbamoyladenosine biosynthesis protein TsaE
MMIGRSLKGGESIELIGDLGTGKTAFVRGLADGMGSDDDVSSPSFTLNNQYKAGKLTLHHFDFYRIQEPGIMQQELTEVLQDPNASVAVEWADPVRSVLPDERLTIRITPDGDTGRNFEFSYPGSLGYLVPKGKGA